MNSPNEHFADEHLAEAPPPDPAQVEHASAGSLSAGDVHPSSHLGASTELPVSQDHPIETRVADPRPAVRPIRAAGSGISDSLQSLLGTVVIAVFVITFIVQAFQIPSPSMENTLLVGDYLLVNKLCYGGGSFADFFMPYRKVTRGDIIVFHYPVNPAQHFVKRVVGVPGDRVRLINKQVFVNGVALKEPWAHFTRSGNDLFRDNFPRLEVAAGETPEWWLQLRKLVDDGQLIVPQGYYFAMGDNRDDSYDSRYWGFVPQVNIIGRPLLIYWSVQGSEGEAMATASVGDKLYHFAYMLTHIFQITRWNRTLRFVR